MSLTSTASPHPKRYSLTTELFELMRFARRFNTSSWEDSAEMQGSLNAYLTSVSRSRTVFQVYAFRQEAVIQVIGETKLDQEIRKCLKTDKTPLDVDTLQGELPLHPWPKHIVEVPVDWNEDQQLLIIFVDPPGYFEAENARILVDNFLGVCICGLLASFRCMEERRAMERCNTLLAHSNWLLSTLGDVNWLSGEALIVIKKMTEADRAILFIFTPDKANFEVLAIDPPSETFLGTKVPVGHTFESYLCSSSNALIRADNTVGKLMFYSKLDEQTLYKTRNVLAFPLKDGTNEVIGGVKLSNRPGGFTKLDEDLAGYFAGLCTSALLHGALHTRLRQGNARAILSSNLLNYVRMSHITTADASNVIQVRTQLDQTVLANLAEFTWNSRECLTMESLAMCMVMIDRLHVTRLLHANRTIVANFLLKVRNAYRPVTYHNWSHAFSVGHFLYCFIYRLDLVARGWLTELEALAMFLAGLCHDVDHRGTTNSFHVKMRSDLGRLYGAEGSIMERHHFAQTLEILSSEECNIFQNLEAQLYREVLEFIRDRILDTDLLLHLTTWKERRNFILSKSIHDLKEHRVQILPLMITCADLCDCTKEWRVTRDCAAMLYQEFFAQGDLEKIMGFTLAPMIDRDKVNIVDMQVNFMQDIVYPCYQLMGQLFPALDYVTRAIEDSKERWTRTRGFYVAGRAAGRPALEIINDPAFTLLATS